MLRSIIIDDEPQSATALKKDLSIYCPSVDVVAECFSAKDGIMAIKKEKPQLVFLDIDMPWMNGFEMLEVVGAITFSIIFTTAFDQYAAKAFRISAVDYLLKPIDIKELKEAVKKAEMRQNDYTADPHIENLLRNIRNPLTEQRIALPNKDGYEFTEVSRIVYCQAEGSYTKVFLTANKTILVSKPLGEIEDLLPPDTFLRIHHSTIVNLRFVTHFIRTDGGYVKLQSGEQLIVSKPRKDALLEKLGLK